MKFYKLFVTLFLITVYDLIYYWPEFFKTNIAHLMLMYLFLRGCWRFYCHENKYLSCQSISL